MDINFIENDEGMKTESCKLFYINRNNKWCLKRGTYRDIELDSFDIDEIDDYLDKIRDNVESLNTIKNIDIIKREIRGYDE